MNGIHEVTGSIPVWSTISNSLIPHGQNRLPRPEFELRSGRLTSPQSVLDRQKRQPLELSDVVDEADCVEGARAAIIMACAAIGVPVFLSATRIDAVTRSTSDSNGLTVNDHGLGLTCEF